MDSKVYGEFKIKQIVAIINKTMIWIMKSGNQLH